MQTKEEKKGPVVCVCVVCSSVDGFPGISFHSNPDRTPRRDSNLQLRQGKKEGMRRMLAAKPTRKENKKGQWCPIAYRQFFRSYLISFLSWLVEIDGRDVGEISGLVIIYAVVVVVLRLSLLVPFVFHSSIALESQGRHIKDSRWTQKKNKNIGVWQSVSIAIRHHSNRERDVIGDVRGAPQGTSSFSFFSFASSRGSFYPPRQRQQ